MYWIKNVGRRVKKTTYRVGQVDTITKYCYDGDRVIAEYDVNDTLLRKFVYGPGIDEPILMIDAVNSKTYYYHFDGLGSVAALSDVNSIVVERYEYKVFGYDIFGEQVIRDANGAIIDESQVGNPYMFTGRRYDDETELYYYRARYYAPQIGRFMQTDTVGMVLHQVSTQRLTERGIYGKSTSVSLSEKLLRVGPIGRLFLKDTQASFFVTEPAIYEYGLNLYTYVSNNPINRIDPSGNFGVSCAPCIGCLGGTALSCYLTCKYDPCVKDAWDCTNECFVDIWWGTSGGAAIWTVRIACWVACAACGLVGS